MNRFFTLILSLFLSVSMYSQINEIGVFVGGSNFVGDVGSTSYIAPNKLALGVLYKWNQTTRLAYRASLMYSKLSANDTESNDISRQLREDRFDTKLTEASVGIEFNFFDFDLYRAGRQFTPYIYTGISYASYEGDLIHNIPIGTRISGIPTSGPMQIQENYSNSSFAIPFNIGVKTTLNSRFILAVEAGARYTFTDDLDSSYPLTYVDMSVSPVTVNNIAFGNINNNDWYLFTGVTLTYTFGQKPCYCAD
ncbi:DUF6089 family protein [Flavobacterium frigidarium]|uniref:type IX secretion system protein PorG n=1 Tax=Flavobacterium frigidarium TaxID=99286 RepID=UPI0030DB4B58|tara:strand:+ start:4071 stop:4823 length:753 start_codon:yes stop_codon:yes gene_type:complete